MRQRNSYPKPFKAQVVRKCLQPGASVSSVAISHGMNANVIRKPHCAYLFVNRRANRMTLLVLGVPWQRVGANGAITLLGVGAFSCVNNMCVANEPVVSANSDSSAGTGEGDRQGHPHCRLVGPRDGRHR